RDDVVAVWCLYVRIEGVGIRYVTEARCSGFEQVPAGRYHHDLGELSPGYQATRSEVEARAGLAGRAAVAPGNYAVIDGGLYVLVERVGGRHVQERGLGRCVLRDGIGEHHDLGHLASRGIVERLESAVSVAGD